MSIFDSLNPLKVIGEGISKVKDLVTGIIDSVNAPDEAKQKIKSELNQQLNELETLRLNKSVELQQELTKRQQIDMTSDSWLSKNIRPLTLIFILAMFTITSIPSMFHLQVAPEFVEILKTWGTTAFMFYFGGRSFEKIISIKNKNGSGNNVGNNTKVDN